MSKPLTFFVFAFIHVLLAFPGLIKAQAGLIDGSFNIGTAANNVVNVIEVLPNGKLFIGGNFSSFNSTPVNRMVRLNTDGTHDFSFASYGTGGGAEGPIRSSALQPDGKILVGGLFQNVHGVLSKNIARLDTNGMVDTSFITGLGASNEVLSIATNGTRIMLGGFFNTYDGHPAPGLVCLHPNGTIDTSFSLPNQSFLSVSDMHLLPNNQVYLAGNFTVYDGMPVNRLIRIHADGSPDTSFNIGIGFNATIHAIAVQADGKIILGGAFSTVNGYSFNRIARLHPDGSVDTTFNPGSGASGGIRKISIQNDGKIILAGDFVNFNGILVNRIARIMQNGSLDMTFTTGTGTNGTVATADIQNDGKILLGGFFTQFNGLSQGRILRLTNDLCLVDTIPPLPDLPVLPVLTGMCEVIVSQAPSATDLCSGPITGTTTDPLIYTSAGYYTIQWSFVDLQGNTSFQQQQVSVTGVDTTISIDTLSPGNIYHLTSNHAGNNVSYTWVDCGNAFNVVGNQQQFTPLQSSSYAVIVSDSLCADTSQCVFVAIVGVQIQELNANATLEVYPNPSQGQFQIAFSPSNNAALIHIYDLSGSCIWTRNITEKNTYDIDLRSHPKGVYFLHMMQDGFSYQRKIIRL